MMDSESSRQDHVSLQDQYCSPNHVHHQRLQKGDVRRKYSVCWAYPCPQVVSRDALPSAGRDSPTTTLRGKLPRPSSLPDQLLATLNSPGGKRQVGEASGNKQSGKWKCWRKKLISRQPRLRQDGLQPCYQVSDLFVWTLSIRGWKIQCWLDMGQQSCHEMQHLFHLVNIHNPDPPVDSCTSGSRENIVEAATGKSSQKGTQPKNINK